MKFRELTRWVIAWTRSSDHIFVVWRYGGYGSGVYVDDARGSGLAAWSCNRCNFMLTIRQGMSPNHMIYRVRWILEHGETCEERQLRQVMES